MDEKPFLVIDLENLSSRDVKALERFSKENLNIDEILEMAVTIIPNTAAKKVTDDFTVVDNKDGTFTVTKKA